MPATKKRRSAANNSIGNKSKTNRITLVANASNDVSGCSLLKRLAIEAPCCCIHAISFSTGKDVTYVLNACRQIAELLSQPTGKGVWAGACCSFLLHESVLSWGEFRMRDMQQLALWNLWSGTCSLPLHLAAGMAIRSLQDFKLQGFGSSDASDQFRNVIQRLIDGPELRTAFTICTRSLEWRNYDDFDNTNSDDDSDFQNVAMKDEFSGYGELCHKIDIGFCFRGCNVTLNVSLYGEVDPGNANCHHAGSVHCDGKTLLRWHCCDGDDEDDSEYTLNARRLHRFSAQFFPDCIAAPSEAEVVQFLWRVLGAPLRWTDTVYPYASHSTFFLHVREAFLRCLKHHANAGVVLSNDEDPFTASPSGPNDSDFMHDLWKLRHEERRSQNV